MAITISGSGITSANIADGTIVNADINSSAAIDGSKLTGAGKVLQVVQSVLTTQASFALSNTWAASGLSVSITPTSTTSKILVRYVLQFGDGAWAYPSGRLTRGGTALSGAISTHTAGKLGTSSSAGSSSGSWSDVTNTEFLDSPATTAATTYAIEVTGYASRAFYINTPSAPDANQTCGISSITLMEIGA